MPRTPCLAAELKIRLTEAEASVRAAFDAERKNQVGDLCCLCHDGGHGVPWAVAFWHTSMCAVYCCGCTRSAGCAQDITTEGRDVTA